MSARTESQAASRKERVVKGVIFSASQPTGRLHLGNLEGALRNWVRLQHEYEMYAGIVDLHALTTVAENTSTMREDVRQVAIDYLAVGIDPEITPIVVQSRVPAHAELHLLLSMLTPVPRLERVPTYKEKREELHIESASYGLLGYPVLQAADILVYRATAVPVGKDQAPHLELSRELAHRFNYLYGEVFPEPETLLTDFAALPGLDGRKMSKSYGNAINLSDPPEEVRRKVMTMFTDPQKLRRGDPGRPHICPVFLYHRIYNPEEVERIERYCMSGALGCVDDKKRLAEKLLEALAPLHEKRRQLEADPGCVEDVLADGARRANEKTVETMALVREAMKL